MMGHPCIDPPPAPILPATTGEPRDMGDRAADAAEAEREISLGEHRLRLHQMAETQDIDEDGVVWCLDCSDPVPAERLAAVPHTARCAGCQAAHELRQRQATGRRRP